MATYSIKDLEKISGIKAHTIRIWEQRYKLLTPNRSDTNIRSYDDEQALKLLNVSTLIHSGEKISKISSMSSDQFIAKLNEVYSDHSEIGKDYFSEINQLIECALNFDQYNFESILSEALERYNFEDIFENILVPVLKRVGQLWTKDELNPAQEHFLSNLIKQKVQAEIEKLELPNKKAKTFLLFLPEWEDHDLGLLYSTYILRKNGIQVIYLGAKVPAINLVESVDMVKPDFLLCSVIGGVLTKTLNEYFKSASKAGIEQIIMSGNHQIISQIKSNMKIKTFQDVSKFKEFIINV
ncbi:MAG: MerR family transcriptional regulator [Cyclobacteriaceae bacterium]